MKKHIATVIIAVLGVGCGYAQQLPQFSNYLINDYIGNPAIGGSKPYFEAKANVRLQWMNLTDAPRTYVLSLHGPLTKLNMGLGGYIFADITGPTRRNGIQLSYSYHLKITNDMRLSFGINGGVLQYAVDGGKITFENAGDIALSSGIQSVIVPDFGAGLYYTWKDRVFLGFSVPQLLNNKLQFFDEYSETGSALQSHFIGMGGYRHPFGDNWKVEGSFLLKYVYPITPQVEGTLRVLYKDMLWLAASYRSEDAVTVTAGYIFQNNLLIAYSYDFTTSNLNNYSSGTHEIMLGVRFQNRNKKNKDQPKASMDSSVSE